MENVNTKQGKNQLTPSIKKTKFWTVQYNSTIWPLGSIPDPFLPSHVMCYGRLKQGMTRIISHCGLPNVVAVTSQQRQTGKEKTTLLSWSPFINKHTVLGSRHTYVFVTVKLFIKTVISHSSFTIMNFSHFWFATCIVEMRFAGVRWMFHSFKTRTIYLSVCKKITTNQNVTWPLFRCPESPRWFNDTVPSALQWITVIEACAMNNLIHAEGGSCKALWIKINDVLC